MDFFFLFFLFFESFHTQADLAIFYSDDLYSYFVSDI